MARKKKATNITARNHYVPQWYQRRFMKDGQHKYSLLDKTPDMLPSGKGFYNNEYHKGVRECFQQEHLYTIDLFGNKSDVIERELFGDIDSKGFKGIDTIAIKEGWKTPGGNQRWQDFIEYMNAQKLRTIKGLDWIKKYIGISNYSQDQSEVMSTLRTIRHLYCTMWSEAIWEVVSADNSKVKFIVSDNPVTFYNYQIPPGSDCNKYPDEPLLSMIGTQTIYPLALNKCLVLTHRQLAQEPESVDPLQDRINARFYDQDDDRAIFNFMDIIHERSFSEKEVCALNYVIKVQSRRYVAAAKKDWLYPERNLEDWKWEENLKMFLPSMNRIGISSGIFFGWKDGSVEGFTPYGEKVVDPEEIKRIKKSALIIKKINRKDRFSDNLIALLNENDTPNIEEQNKLLIDGLADIFGINDGCVDKFVKNFSPDKVRQLYYLIEDLWPAGTDVFKFLSPDDNFNLIYSGELDCKILPWKLFSLGLYFDKVYIVNPFPNPCSMKDEFKPSIYPEKYLATTYDLFIMIISLIPWIETGQIQILPNPFLVDFPLRKLSIENIEERNKCFTFQPDDDFIKRKTFQEFERILFLTPEESIEQTAKKLFPTLSEDLIVEFAKDIREKKNKPLSWTKSLEEIGPQFHTDKIGENLEAIMYLAHLTNSIPYTYLKFKREEIESINKLTANSVDYKLKVLNGCDGYFVKAIKESGILSKIRVVLRKLKANPYCTDLHEELKVAISESEEDWDSINKILKSDKSKDFLISHANITFNTGDFTLPSIQKHLKDVYSNNILSDVRMHIST